MNSFKMHAEITTLKSKQVISWGKVNVQGVTLNLRNTNNRHSHT